VAFSCFGKFCFRIVFFWLTQNQIAEIYDTTKPNVSQHIDGILKDGELYAVATHKKFLLVQTEGKRQV